MSTPHRLPRWAREYQGTKGLGKELVWCNNNRNRGAICKTVLQGFPVRPRPLPPHPRVKRVEHPHPKEPRKVHYPQEPITLKYTDPPQGMSMRAFDYGAITRDVVGRLSCVRDVPFSEMPFLPEVEHEPNLYRILRGTARRAWKTEKWRV